MLPLGRVAANSTQYIPFHTFDSNDPSASVTLSGLLASDIEIYKNGGATQRSSDAGYTLLDTDGIDFDSTTGIHGFSVDLSDNTDAGFYEVGAQYFIVVASVTVDAATVNFVAAHFTIAPELEIYGAAYQGPRGPGVYLNDAAANTTTVNGVDGTVSNPVSTIAAAKTIADSMSLDRIYLVNDSAITLAATMVDYEFVGIGHPDGNTIALASQDISNSSFFNVSISGVQTGTGRALFEDCFIGTATLHLVARRCGFTDAVTGITFSSNDDNILDSCFSMVAGNAAPIFICSGANLDLSMRHHSGGTEFKALASTATVSVEADGQVIFNADCNVNAAVTIRGNCTITDNTAGMSVLTDDARLTRSEIVDEVWDELKSAHTVADSFGDYLDTEVSGVGGGSAAAIADAVWDEAQADHVAAGSFGEIATEIAAVLADTNELQTDDVPGLIAALNDVAATDIVSAGAITTLAGAVVNVDLVDTTTTNTDMVASAPTAAAIADAVWEEAQVDHASVGTFGEIATEVASILVDTGEIGAAGAGLTNINLPDQTMNITGDITGNLSGSVGSLTGHTVQTGDTFALANGATGFVAIDTVVDQILVDTGTTIPGTITTLQADTDDIQTRLPAALVGGAMNADVSAIQASAITAASIATDAIGAAELAADAVAEISGAVWDEDATGHQTQGTFGQAIGDPVADTTTIYQAVATDASGDNVAADIIAVKAETAAILVDTGTDIPARFDGVEGATFSSATDSLEAIRDRGDAAWITGAGGTPPQLLQSTTIATLATQVSFTLTAGSTDDDAYNGAIAVITDQSTSTQKAVGAVSDYTGSTKTVTLSADPGIFTMATGDTIEIIAALGTGATAADIRAEIDSNSTQLAAIVADTNELQTDDVPGLIAALNDVAATDIVSSGAITTLAGAVVNVDLVDVTTTNTDMVAAAPTAASVADAVWDEAQAGHVAAGSFGEIATEVASILADTNELQTDDIPGLIAALNDVAATDIVSAGAITTLAGAVVNVDLVDTTTTNTDMVAAAPTAASVADAVWEEAQADHTSAGTFGFLGVETALILADTNELQADDVPGLISTLDAVVDTVKVDTAAILIDTNELQTDDYPTSIAALQTDLDTLTAGVNVTQIAGVTAAATGLSLSADTIVNGTASGTPTTTTMVSDVGITVDDQLNGRIIIFADNTTTAALRDQATDITGCTAASNTLVFSALTTAPVSGDTFVIV